MPSHADSSRVLWALVALGLLASLLILSDRFARERANGAVEVVLDYRSVADLARSQGASADDVLARFRAEGVTSVALDEQTLDDLAFRGVGRAFPGLALADLQQAGQVPAGVEPRPDRLYVVARKAAAAAELQASAEATLGRGRATLWPGPGSSIVELKVDPRTFGASGLGIPVDLVRHLHGDLGFRVWLRPENTPGASAEAVVARVRALAALPGVGGVIFSGARNEALGYPDHLDQVAGLLDELDLDLGVIELPDKVQQKGIETLARRVPNRVVRVMAIPPAQQARTHPDTVVAMFGLGARERNMRILYLRPYADLVEEVSADEANTMLLQGLRAELGSRLAAQASTFPQARGGWLLAWVMAAAGAGAATALLVGQVGPAPGWASALLVLALAGGTAATALTGVMDHAWRALMALGTATVYPVLGLALQLPALEGAVLETRRRDVLLRATGALLGASAVSLAGALAAASFLPETTYMLSVDIFRGVKLHSVLVPLLVLVLWMSRQRSLEAVVRVLDERIRAWHLLVLVVLGVLAAVYVARTGNVTGDFAVSDTERALRRWLDDSLGVRPRFKEFLLGNPALFLAPVLAWLRWRGLVPFALLAAAVGQASLTDTYAHIHTPLAISLTRTALGLLVGWGLGTALALLLMGLHRRVTPRLERLRQPAAGPGAPVEVA